MQTIPLRVRGIQAPDFANHCWKYLSKEEALTEMIDTLSEEYDSPFDTTAYLQLLYDVITRMPGPEDIPILQALVSRWSVI